MKHFRPRNLKDNGQMKRLNQTLTRYIQEHIYEVETSQGLHGKAWFKHSNNVIYNYNLAKNSASGNFSFPF